MVSRQHIHWARHAAEQPSHTLDQFTVNGVVFESVAGEQEEIDSFFRGKLANPCRCRESCRPNGVGGGSGMDGPHADLPVGRMNEPHNWIVRQQVAHGMSHSQTK